MTHSPPYPPSPGASGSRHILGGFRSTEQEKLERIRSQPGGRRGGQGMKKNTKSSGLWIGLKTEKEFKENFQEKGGTRDAYIG